MAAVCFSTNGSMTKNTLTNKYICESDDEKLSKLDFHTYKILVEHIAFSDLLKAELAV